MKTIRKNQKVIAIIIFLLIIIILFYLKIKLDNNKYQNISVDKDIIENKNNDNNDICMIDIKGAVNNPGVYSTKCTDNVSDQTTPNMIQRISGVFERKPLISRGL